MVAYNSIMSKFSNTSAIATFKTTNGIKDLAIMTTDKGKPYFKCDNGIEGKMSVDALTAIESGDLSNVRVSNFDPEDGNNSFFMIHMTSSDESTHTKVLTL